jgi:hypothetical protein
MAIVQCDLVEAGTIEPEAPGGLAVHPDPDLTAPVEGGVATAGRVLDLERLAGARPPEAVVVATGEDLVARLRQLSVAEAGDRQRIGQGPLLLTGAELLTDRVLGLGVGPQTEVEPAQGPAAAPEEERRPALAAVRVPDPVLAVVGDWKGDVQPLQRCGERLALAGRARAW